MLAGAEQEGNNACLPAMACFDALSCTSGRDQDSVSYSSRPEGFQCDARYSTPFLMLSATYCELSTALQNLVKVLVL